MTESSDLTVDELLRVIGRLDEELGTEKSLVSRGSITLTIFGGAAVMLLLHDAQLPVTRATRDIDASLTGEANSVVRASQIPRTLQRGSPQSWNPPSAWSQRCIVPRSLSALRVLTARVLHPLDLIVMKLQRGAPRDIEDIQSLVDGWSLTWAEIRQELDDAWRHAATGTGTNQIYIVRSSVDDAFGQEWDPPDD